MVLFYVDESGNTGLNLDSADQPVHWIVALGVTPEAIRAIEAEMLALALRVFRNRARKADFEFHGSDIFGGRGDCSNLSPAERIQVYAELLRLLARHDCALFVQGIDKARHKARARTNGYEPMHPHRLGFMYLLERIDEWLERAQPELNFFGDLSGPPLYGLMVADEQKEIDREIVQQFAFWREGGTDFGYRSRELKFLIDTIHYVPSHDSWLIQLVDCVAYIKNRFERMRREKGADEQRYTASETAVAKLWRENCAEQVVSEYCWP